jgi:hypothetical protein
MEIPRSIKNTGDYIPITDILNKYSIKEHKIHPFKKNGYSLKKKWTRYKVEITSLKEKNNKEVIVVYALNKEMASNLGLKRSSFNTAFVSSIYTE